MDKLTQSVTREIIEDFAKQIRTKREKGPKPSNWVIAFRNDLQIGKERPVYYVPMDLLRFRKNNGRITSDVLSYEKNYGLLDERSEQAQKKLREFLEEKDAEKTEELRLAILKDGQREPAIITCDGFLINGNRRKVVLQRLLEQPEYSGATRFKTMKVVILPGEDDEGGPPTLVEIEELENRYQLQSEGKAEYYGFDRALSIRRKIELGMPIEQQLRDDPSYAQLSSKEFAKKVEKIKDELLRPLDCVDRYLSHLNREGLYNTVSAGMSDPEGRWQAFIDYYNSVYKKICDEKQRIKLHIHENEVGQIEDAAFKIIRTRNLPQLPKAHQIMRKMPKYLAKKECKAALLKLAEIDMDLVKKETLDNDGNEMDQRLLDLIWGKKYQAKVVQQLKRAENLHERESEQETPEILLEAALKKLNHEDMEPEKAHNKKRAMQLAEEIVSRANELKSQFYRLQKNK